MEKTEEFNYGSRQSIANNKRLNDILFDKHKILLKILRLSQEKLIEHNENALAKGLDW